MQDKEKLEGVRRKKNSAGFLEAENCLKSIIYWPLSCMLHWKDLHENLVTKPKSFGLTTALIVE